MLPSPSVEAIWLPSGDQTGPESHSGPKVSRRLREPSRSTIHNEELERLSVAEAATRRPSGDSRNSESKAMGAPRSDNFRPSPSNKVSCRLPKAEPFR